MAIYSSGVTSLARDDDPYLGRFRGVAVSGMRQEAYLCPASYLEMKSLSARSASGQHRAEGYIFTFTVVAF